LGTARTEEASEKLREKLGQQNKASAFHHKLHEWTTTLTLSCFYTQTGYYF